MDGDEFCVVWWWNNSHRAYKPSKKADHDNTTILTNNDLILHILRELDEYFKTM